MSFKLYDTKQDKKQTDEKHDVPFQTSALFCANCGMLLQIQQLSLGYSGKITCQFCRHGSDLEQLLGSAATVEHTKSYEHMQKEWLTGPHEKKEKEKAIIEEDCPIEECNSKRLYFWTVQLRSVDEGQTVFYECVKCGHNFKDHT